MRDCDCCQALCKYQIDRLRDRGLTLPVIEDCSGFDATGSSVKGCWSCRHLHDGPVCGLSFWKRATCLLRGLKYWKVRSMGMVRFVNKR